MSPLTQDKANSDIPTRTPIRSHTQGVRGGVGQIAVDNCVA